MTYPTRAPPGVRGRLGRTESSVNLIDLKDYKYRPSFRACLHAGVFACVPVYERVCTYYLVYVSVLSAFSSRGGGD